MTIYCIRWLAKSPGHVISFGTNPRATLAPEDRLRSHQVFSVNAGGGGAEAQPKAREVSAEFAECAVLVQTL